MFNKLEARVLSEYFCTLIKHYFSFIKHYFIFLEEKPSHVMWMMWLFTQQNLSPRLQVRILNTNGVT
jgi:hypothetical protein